MFTVKRLRLLTAALGVGAASAAVGTVVFGDAGATRPAAAPARPDPAVPLADPVAKTRFSDAPALTYRLESGETVFAWQVRPALAAQPARPRDVLVMVDTSASQAGEPIARARAILAALAHDAGADDRIDVWTANINHPSATRSLTDGLRPAGSDAVRDAVTKLADVEYGSGAVDLKAGLEQAAKQFDRRAGRTQVILYLGDGESAASTAPFTEAVRAELGTALADREIVFFAVPLGATINAHNLHGLAAMTGGTVVRATPDALGGRPRTEFVGRLKEAFDAPVLRPDRAAFGPEGVEVFPSRLPPLRADRPTLVVGTVKGPAQAVAVRVDGRVNGARVTVDLSERLPDPADDNYFLNAMLAQWRAAPAKDAPAILAADRALAMAAEQFRLFRDEYAVQAVQAISVDRLDHAEKLFQAAARIDPRSPEAAAGAKVLAKIRGGNLDAGKLKTRLNSSEKIGVVLRDLGRDDTTAAVPVATQPPATPAAPPAAGPTPVERDLIQQARAAQAVIDQEFRILVEDTLRRGRRLKLEAPDQAYEDLKRQRDAVLGNDQLSEPTRRRLVLDLETEMRDVQLRGAEIARRTASERQRVAQARQRLNEFDTLAVQEEQTRNRIDQFRQLMQQARFELAQAEAQTMIQERTSQGLPGLPETQASYRIGQSATNLREFTELQRVRQNNYLLTMMQTEKSFIPYPDEPPVHFPPAAVWRQLTGNRTEKYGFFSLGQNVPQSFRSLRSVLEGDVDKRVQLRDLNGKDIQTVLQQLQQEFQEYGVKFVFRTDLLPADFKPSDVKLKSSTDLTGLPLGAFLDIILRDVDAGPDVKGLSWVARPEYIEIGPMMALRYDEKVAKVFDVAELVIGIPQSVNPQTLYQNLQFIGQQATIFGAAFNPFNGVGVLGVGGGIAGGIGGFGGGGLGAGGFGGGGFPGGGLGAGGGGFPGGGLGAGGGAGAGGFQGAGFGGGGFAGQFGSGNPLGNLSGQFGIQGNDQSRFLLTLITSVVARNEWDLRQISGQAQPLFSQQEQEDIGADAVIERRQLNSLGFYPPAKALVVRGSHRYHPSPSFKLRKVGEQAGAGGPGLPGRGQVAGNVPAAGGNAKDGAKAAVAAIAKDTGKDPAKLWNAAFESALTDPMLLVETFDILAQMSEFTHAAEAVKAGLRKGRTSGAWAHEALALALQGGKAAPAEVERAALSAVDLDPADPKAYLKAAKAESDLGRPEIALAFCKRAAALEPNLPASYADALAYAEKSADVASDAVSWAGENLLRRDWSADGVDYHAQAKDRVGRIAKKFAAAGRADDAAKVQAVVAEDKTRDLVIELLWQGRTADLDLTVIEPTGSKCSATHKRTTGGGVLKADILEQGEDRSELYTAAQAFTGTYTVTVKAALGKPLGNQATVRVTRFQGTKNEVIDLYGVDLAAPKPIQVRLDGGVRTELASVPADDLTDARQDTTRAPASVAPSGFNGGTGAGSTRLMTQGGAAKAAVPVVSPTVETKLSAAGTGLPGLRLEAKLSADRQRVVMTANPVFTGPAADLPLPKVNLLPGGGE